MNCPKYLALTSIEKIEFIGKCVHAIQSDDAIFYLAQKIVKAADKKGLFEGVTINPATTEDNNTE